LHFRGVLIRLYHLRGHCVSWSGFSEGWVFGDDKVHSSHKRDH